ncbi:cytochrome protein [Xylaria sp. CBS 124048]|nr:cytochrome protein [Xylaria sp. CBS 124048]
MSTIGTLGAGIVFATALIVSVRLTLALFAKKPGPLPPGPKGLPFFGNIRDLPPPGQRECDHWIKHKDLYGPISSVTVLGTTIVIVQSPELAIELLEKRSLNYSSRPKFTFAEIAGFGNILPMLPYNKTLRSYRRAMHSMLGSPAAVASFMDRQEIESQRLLMRILHEPESFLEHIRTAAGAFILKMIYGYTIEPHKPDRLVQLIDASTEYFAAAAASGTWLVDILPALRYLPEWMPGTGWKKTAKLWNATVTETGEKPLRFARKQAARGNPEKSYVNRLYREKGDELTHEDHELIKWSAFSLYGGGADTTVSTISAFLLAMTLYPDVQRKAREEIDRVIGSGRLPKYSDKEHLPYVGAVVSEAWRWHTVAPIVAPHMAEAADTINGYYIPKGALVIANLWWFTHDPAVYPDPSLFNPLRFLGPNPAPDPNRHNFGYGRRICPGQHLARSSVWVTIAQLLAVFDISKGLDENGREIEPIVASTPGIVSRPRDFKAIITPRSPQHEALIREAERLYPWEESHANEL